MESDKSEQTNPQKSQALLGMLKADSLGKVSAVFFGVIYLCGFLTLNSHLYKYGVVELGIASTEYLVAGAVFVLYLSVYGIFAGRSIILSKHWLGQHIDHLKERNAPSISPLIAFVHMFIELAFFHCLSAALFSTFAFGQIESFGFYAVLSLVFIVSYGMDTSNWDVRHPFAHLIIDGLLKLIAVFSFFYLSSGSNIYIVFAAFFGYSMYINLVLDSFERYRITKDRIVFNMGYTAIFILLSAVTFGSSVYGNVSKKIGGGKAIEVTIGLNENSLEGHVDEIESPISGEVVYSTQDNVYIKIEKDTLIIPRTSVKWMSFHEKNNDGMFEFLKKMESDREESADQNEPNKSTQPTPKNGAADG
jgi:hypothetical protein